VTVGGDPQPFDACGPLPGAGVTILEASAGTGKTFTIAALTARLVADGVELSHILAVTFTRMATGELRDRVRERLVSAEDRLTRWLEGGTPVPEEDAVARLLASGPEDLVRSRRDRLAKAVAGFDAATITTTHGFCQLVLSGLGVEGEVPAGATLLEETADLVEEVVDDLYVRRALGWGTPVFDRRTALAIGLAAVDQPDTPLVPAGGDDTPGRRARLAELVRREVARRLRDANQLTYDDMLVRLRNALADPTRGTAACDRMRDQYHVVLVDEFQDTDPVQWDVVRRAFGTGATTLVLIGDPKQAIYAFRGADVYSYLDATALAGERYTLGQSWRSDRDLLQAFDALLDPLQLGHPDIPYRRVDAVPGHVQPGVTGAPDGAALRVRIVDGRHPELPHTRTQGLIVKGAAREWVAADLAADVVGLLSSGAELVARDEEDRQRGLPRRVAPGDVAVLVGTNSQARIVQEALRAAGVPAVVAGGESVFATAAATYWLRLLEALEQPAARARAVGVALTPFIGMTAEAVARASEDEWEDVHTRMHRWAEILRRRGVAVLFRVISTDEGLPGRLLRDGPGEREITDLAHVAQLLHAQATAEQLGPLALRAWLARRRDQAQTEAVDTEERSQRLDSDADAVQVLTIHRAKGLEFPVVYCPYLWHFSSHNRAGEAVVFHDAATGVRLLDVGGEQGGGHSDHALLATRDGRGEDLRTLYVALTRARHQAVIWWARAHDCQHSALGRLLMLRDGQGAVPASGKFVPKDEAVMAKLTERAQAVPGRISVAWAAGAGGERWTGADPVVDESRLAVASFERSLDDRWRRTSYSGITAALHEGLFGRGALVDSEPESRGITDEPAATSALADDGRDDPVLDIRSSGHTDRTAAAVPLPLAAMPGGTEVGTFVHAVLEAVDFASADLSAEVRTAVGAELARHPVNIGDPEAVTAGLVAAIATPLGPVTGGVSLRDIRRPDRLDELGFELPLAGGDRPRGQVVTAEVGRLLAEHLARTPETAPGVLAGYGARLADPLLATDLRGYLSGSLDLVFRVPAEDGPRYFVADYKTNRLGSGERLTTWDYRPVALDEEMQHLHYPLQALLYLTALHRYLRWRQPAYEPTRHLGGVLYLFLRGMVGPATPFVDGGPCGVFSWRPPTSLVTELSDLLDSGSSEAGAAR
jgi:exodeoxyribonuclease V beta subunit